MGYSQIKTKYHLETNRTHSRIFALSAIFLSLKKNIIQPGLLLSDFLIHTHFTLFYKGSHSDNPSLNLVTMAENNLNLVLKKGLVKRLSYIIIEAVQNIERYSYQIDGSEDFSLIFSDATTFHVITENLIENKNIEQLKNRLDSVNAKHEEELNEFYMQHLNSGEYTAKGAGLGLIDIARKSKNNLSYLFTQRSDNLSAYRLHIKLPISEDGIHLINPERTTKLVSGLVNTFSSNRSTLFYSGDFSNTFLQSLLEMLKNSKRTEKLSLNTNVHHALIELTQNIRRHGTRIDNRIPGYLSIEWKNDRLCLSTFNVINEEKIGPVSDKINLLNQKSTEELNKYSQEILSDFNTTGGMGLIDVALLSRPNKLSFDLVKNTTLGNCIQLTCCINYEPNL